jgi:hypothetical protein
LLAYSALRMRIDTVGELPIRCSDSVTEKANELRAEADCPEAERPWIGLASQSTRSFALVLEPSRFLLAALGLVGVASYRRRRTR